MTHTVVTHDGIWLRKINGHWQVIQPPEPAPSWRLFVGEPS
jgi:hypothetical protein